MRTKPLVGQKAWFGPRRLGWGLAPASPAGWAVTAATVAAAIALATADHHQPWISALAVAAFLVVVILKGTSPGGPREWEEYQASKGDGRSAQS
jgi:hypothetical protein